MPKSVEIPSFSAVPRDIAKSFINSPETSPSTAAESNDSEERAFVPQDKPAPTPLRQTKRKKRTVPAVTVAFKIPEPLALTLRLEAAKRRVFPNLIAEEALSLYFAKTKTSGKK